MIEQRTPRTFVTNRCITKRYASDAGTATKPLMKNCSDDVRCDYCYKIPIALIDPRVTLF